MKAFKIVLLALAFFIGCVGCVGCGFESEAKRKIKDESGFIYIQDSETGMVFAVSENAHGDILVPVPTDQIESVKSKIKNYKEPEFLTKYKNRDR